MEELSISKLTLRNLNKVKAIYFDSFVKEERFPFFLLLLNIVRKNSELYVISHQKKVVAFIYFIHYQKSIFILYLATNTCYRRKGYGSFLLDWCIKNNSNCDIYLNIDEVNNNFADYKVRKERLHFYLSNGFHFTDYLSVEKYGNFNILCTNSDFDLEKYKKLDKIISRYFFNSKSKIIKME